MDARLSDSASPTVHSHHVSAPSLLGLTAGGGERDDDSSNGSGTTRGQRLSSVNPKGKRQTATAACEGCRRRKSKCDTKRPRCGMCTLRGHECVYVTIPAETHTQALKRKYEDMLSTEQSHKQFHHLLTTRPEGDAVELLRRLRQGHSIEQIVRQTHHGDLLLQLALKPEARFRYEFPFVRDMPAFLLIPANPYLSSTIYDTTLLVDPATPPTKPKRTDLKHHCSYLMPHHAAALIEPKIFSARISQWTAVVAIEDVLRELMAAYFQHEYPWFAAFPKHLFLRDLVEESDRFCSSLLVNVILAAACHSYDKLPDRYMYWEPHTLQYKFLAEVRRLWELEAISGNHKVTTIQAAIILNIAYNNNGIDKIGDQYLVQAMAMAHDMKLFNKGSDTESEEARLARDFTAWCLFSFQTMTSYYFYRAPQVQKPPYGVLPDPDAHNDWYGEIHIQYPQQGAKTPLHFGHVFKATMQLRVILNDISVESFGQDSNGGLTLQRTFHYQDRLTAWFKALPDVLSPKNIFHPIHIKVHIEYYNVLINLFKPHLSIPLEQVPTAFSTINRAPKEIVEHAQTCFETLVRLSYLRHGFEHFDSYLLHFIIHLANMSMEGLESATDRELTQALRSTVLLCIKGINDQSMNYHVAGVVLPILLQRLSPHDLALMRSCVVPGETLDAVTMKEHVLSAWPIPIIRADDDPRTKEVSYLVEEYSRITLEESNGSENGLSPEKDEDPNAEADT